MKLFSAAHAVTCPLLSEIHKHREYENKHVIKGSTQDSIKHVRTGRRRRGSNHSSGKRREREPGFRFTLDSRFSSPDMDLENSVVVLGVSALAPRGAPGHWPRLCANRRAARQAIGVIKLDLHKKRLPF